MIRKLTELKSKYILGLISKEHFKKELISIIEEAQSDREKWLAKAFLNELD